MIKDNEKREKKVVDLYNEVVESRGGDSGLDNLNLLKLDYGYRVRYEKDESGAITAKIMDRGFIGLIGAKIGLDCQDVITCFVYGKKTVGFAIVGDSVVANSKLKDSSDFNVLLLNVIKEKNLTGVDWVDYLPTGAVERKTSQKTLSDCLNNIKTIENLNCELGF